MEPGTILPIHRHIGSTEIVVLLRGKISQNFYYEAGQLVMSFHGHSLFGGDLISVLAI